MSLLSAAPKILPVMLHLDPSCEVGRRHFQGSAKLHGGSISSAPPGLLTGDLTARINTYNKKIGLREFRVLEYDFSPSGEKKRIWFHGSRRAH